MKKISCRQQKLFFPHSADLFFIIFRSRKKNCVQPFWAKNKKISNCWYFDIRGINFMFDWVQHEKKKVLNCWVDAQADLGFCCQHVIFNWTSNYKAHIKLQHSKKCIICILQSNLPALHVNFKAHVINKCQNSERPDANGYTFKFWLSFKGDKFWKHEMAACMSESSKIVNKNGYACTGGNSVTMFLFPLSKAINCWHLNA